MINERTTMSFQKTCRNVFSVSLGLVLIGTSNGCTSSFLKSNNKTPVQSNTDWFGFMTKKTSTNPGFQNGNVEADAKTDTKQSRLDLLLAMGHNHVNHDDIPAAIRAYDESLKVEQNVEAHHRLGMLYFKKGDKELSNKHLSMAIKLDPNNSDVIADAGYLLYMSGDLANAENMTRASITQSPNDERLHNNLGIILAAQRRHKESLDAFVKAGNSRTNALANLGHACLLTEQLPEAETYLKMASESKTPNTKASKTLAMLQKHHNAPIVQTASYIR
jgi:Flp pilus assembly protein TadD